MIPPQVMAGTTRTFRFGIGKYLKPRDVGPTCMALALVAWAPFYFGASEPVGWGLNAILFSLGALLNEAHQVSAGMPRPIEIRRFAVPIGLFAICVLWILLQIATWTPSAWHHPIWQMASDALGTNIPGSISVNRAASWAGLLRLGTAAVAFWFIVQLCSSERNAYAFIFGFAGIASAYAALGIVWVALFQGKVLWVDVPAMRGLVTATFYNRNTYATYGALGLVVWIGLLLHAVEATIAQQRGPLKYRVIWAIEAAFGPLLPFVAGTMVCALALLLTGSRGGVLAAFCAIAVLILVRMIGRRASLSAWLFTVGAAGACVVLLLATFGDVLGARLAQLGASDPGRWATYKATLSAIGHSPVAGYGYSTFADIFPMFRQTESGIWGSWEMAHNSYLDIGIGLGVPVALCLLGIFGFFGLQCLKAALGGRKNVTIPAIGVAALVCVAIHSTIDFSMEIQGVTLTLVAILATGVAQSVLPVRTAGRENVSDS